MEVSELVSVLTVVSVSLAEVNVTLVVITAIAERVLLCVLLREFINTEVAVGTVPSQVATQ